MEDLDLKPREKTRKKPSTQWRNIWEVVLPDPSWTVVLGEPEFPSMPKITTSGVYPAEATWPSKDVALTVVEDLMDPRKWSFRGGPPLDLRKYVRHIDTIEE